mmetsp:Transcript_94065/g.280730  ORF Transcript_94065/g.280730 Transcript_94065/m.280730 type:complete len:327 (-) Transcript_94065:22-1002(-)
MPRVAKLNGESPATQPREDELAGDYRIRLAEELGVRPECVGFLGGRAAVPSSAELSSFGAEEVLQVVICPSGETICGWTVRMLLSELCVEGARPDMSLAQERLRAVEIQKAEELHNAIQIIISRVLEQPTRFKECTDVVVALNARWPELPMEEGDSGEGHGKAKAKTFKGELFDSVVQRFAVLRQSTPPQDEGGEGEEAEGADASALHRQRAVALMAFLGQLFVRQVMEIDGLNAGAHDLIGRDDHPPGDHQMACAVELLTVAGPSLDATPGGRPVMTHWLDRVCQACSWAYENSLNIFSQPVLAKAEELVALRRRNWGKPVSGFA